MANRSHVPKFGDWNNQDQPFTVVFDNARTNKRQDLYESFEKEETKTQAKTPTTTTTQPASRNSRQEPPKQLRDDMPRATPPNRVRAPPADQLYGGGGGGLYGGYVGGGGSGRNQRPPQASRPVQPKHNPRGGNNGRGTTTIPPFPGSVGADENVSYTHIFDQVKEERNRQGGRSYGGTANNTPSRPIINGSDSTTSSKICCFPWYSKATKY